MDITRHNYEEYFILYLDNELPVADRLKVEAFAAEHPDLKEELELLLSSKLVPDTELVFAPKEQLFKTSGISQHNAEEWLLLYTDNELTADQRLEVEALAATHPAIKQELEQLLRTRLQADSNIVFPDKASLYRKEEKAKLVAMPWKRIAVAAAILFAIGTTVFITLDKNNSDNGSSVAETGEPKQQQQQPAADPVNVEKIGIEKQEIAQQKDAPTPEVKSSNEKLASNAETRAVKNKIPANEDKQQQVLAADQGKQHNNLPQPYNNPYINNTDQPIASAKLEAPSNEALTVHKEIKQFATVTPEVADPLDNIRKPEFAVQQTIADEEEPGRKNKLRGFFRKVTRTFEKTTNIKATDDEDRLLIGGLAIRL